MDMEDTLEHIRYGSMVGMLESTVVCVCVIGIPRVGG